MVAPRLLAACCLLMSGCGLMPPKPTTEQKLAAFARKMAGHKAVVLRTELQGRPMAFLLRDCKVHLLDASGEEVRQEEVVACGTYLWFAGCMDQSIRAENGYVYAYLRNMAFGAGGGNASGGDYRTRDGRNWEKQTARGWKPVAEAQ